MAGYYGKNYEKPDDALIESSQEAASTPDYSSSQDNAGNPFYEGNTDTNADIIEDDDDEEKKNEQEAQPETPAVADTEAARTAAAQEQNANVYAAIGNIAPPSDEYLSSAGISRGQWDQMNAVMNSGNAQKFVAELQSSPEGRAILNSYNSYYSAPNAATSAPAQQAPENPILPSAGGTQYQADKIYDPSKTYGRQADGSFVFSNSARELQNNLAREGYYKGAIDGYFGQQTQDALNAYLAEHGIKTEPDKGADTLTQAAQEAPKAETPSNVEQAVQNSTGNSNNPAVPSTNVSGSKPAHDDAWYAEQYEKITGSAPRTDILSPERIRDFVDKESAKRPATPEDEGYDAMLQQQALYEQAQEQQRLNEMNARRDDAFTPKFINDLRNGKSVEQILGEGDKSYNRWIEDNWDDLSYTYNLSESPFGNQTSGQEREPINYAAMLDELSQMDRNDWYQRPESQATAQREPINYNAIADDLAQMDRNDWYQRPESQPASATERTPINYDAMAEELFQTDRNDWYQRPETTRIPERTPIEYSDAFIRQQDMNDAYFPRQSFNDNYQAELERIQNGGMASDDIQSSSGTSSSEEQDMLAAYEAAMQSAGRARDIFQGLPTEAEQIQQTREQWQQNMRTALEDQFNNPYMQQFRKDFEDVQRQFPNYSYSALADMVLFNEEMRNGQSSYYKWMANHF